ncbi:MAG: antibiotic biosynthesis monooxygenase [Chloroflexi bacterium]|nr:antibiotic biosynthesis monooxygenase [Chloroflexota bacterium]
MYIRIRGWEATPGKEAEFDAALKEIVGWIRESPGCVSADMVRTVGVGEEGKYFSLIRFQDEDSYYRMQETVRNPRIVPRLEGLGRETWELVVGESIE